MGRRITTEECKQDFIRKANEKHDNKYDYSKVEYVGSKTKVCIICPIHGEFLQTPNGHLSKHGCPKCAGLYKTTKWFIENAKLIYGELYDYSKSIYVNYGTKICIICKEHGEFWQLPSSHLNGHGCSKCTGTYSPTTEEFIEKARIVYGDKYDYSKVVYKGNKIKVCIICHEKDVNGVEHGEFWKDPCSHLKGQGCKKCPQTTKEEFIKKANKKYKNKYDYSKVFITNFTTPVCIICPIHGEFIRTPSQHLSKGGECSECLRILTKNKNSDNFIKNAIKKHGDRYDYSKVEYIDILTEVCIICKEDGHGEFWQTPMSHLNNDGCHKCSSKYMNKEIFVEKAKLQHGNKYNYDNTEYINARSKLFVNCPEHGEFGVMSSDHLRGSGCPICAAANNISELKILNLIKDKFVDSKVIYQYKEKWLGLQSIDIFLVDYNIGIEYQGDQHFQPVKFFGGEERHEYEVVRDIKKSELCAENKVDLLYFTYNRRRLDFTDYIGKVYTKEEELISKIKNIINLKEIAKIN